MYELNSANDQFKNRSKTLFNNLEKLESEHSNKRKQYEQNIVEKDEDLVECEDNLSIISNNTDDSSQNKLKSKYTKNHKYDHLKWKKYSLENVNEINNISNSNVAIDFLSKIKSQKDDEKKDDFDENFKPIFNLKSNSQTILKKDEIKHKVFKNENISSRLDDENDIKSNEDQSKIADKSHKFKKTIKTHLKTFKKPESE